MKKVMTEIQAIQSDYEPKSSEMVELNDRSNNNYLGMTESIDQMIRGCDVEDVDLFNQGISKLNNQLIEKQKIGDDAFRLARANRLNWVEQLN